MQNDWNSNAVMYGIDVARFYDSNADGIGDFDGLIQKMAYIDSLGVNCLLLHPFFPSTHKKDGHDLTDYVGIEKTYGTIEDFDRFVVSAHQKNMKVMIELDIGHTSNEHPWFRDATKGHESPYYDYYMWSDDSKNGHDTVPVKVENDQWHYDDDAKANYRYASFPFQPALNLTNEMLRKEFEAVVEFWIEHGVDGFKLNAYKQTANEDVVHKFIAHLRNAIGDRWPEVIFFTDIEMHSNSVKTPSINNSNSDLLYDTSLHGHVVLGLARHSSVAVADCLHQISDKQPAGTLVNFLRGNDGLHLDSLALEERNQVFKELAPEFELQAEDPKIHLALPTMIDDVRQLKMAYSLLFALPGIPMFTYGSEIGLADNTDVSGSLVGRAPMQWNDGRCAGFSETTQKTDITTAIVRKGPFSFKKCNVEIEEKNPESLLGLFRALIQIRKEHPGLVSEHPIIMENKNSSVLVLRYGSVMALHNLSDQSQTFEAPILTDAITVYGEDYLNDKTLGPFGYSWIALDSEDSAVEAS